MLSLREDVLRVQTAEVQHILKQHMNRAVDKANHQRVNIRRQELLKDAFRQFKHTSFDATKMLRITFLGESAVDGGGPRREFFRLLLADLFTLSGLFVGYPCSVTAAHNVVSLENGDYAIVAKVVSNKHCARRPCTSLLFSCNCRLYCVR